MNTGSASNHFKWGWGDTWFNTPANVNESFKISLTSAGTAGSFHDETVIAATLIANVATKPIMVCLSGGIDSQVVCLALIEAKVPFTAFTMCWLDSTSNVINYDDVSYAKQFCHIHNINHQLDTKYLEHFLNGLGSQAAEEHCIQHYRLLTQVCFADMFKNTHTVLTGDGNVSFDMADDTLVVDFPSTVIHQFFHKNNIDGTAHFFKYTPELMLSQIDNEIAHSFIKAYQSLYAAYAENSKTPYWSWRVFGSYVKPMIYESNWEGLLHRSKQHGFETYDDSYWKRRIIDLGGKKFGNTPNMISIEANEFLSFMRMPKGTERVWYK